jgi:hypothetical protein
MEIIYGSNDRRCICIFKKVSYVPNQKFYNEDDLKNIQLRLIQLDHTMKILESTLTGEKVYSTMKN